MPPFDGAVTLLANYLPDAQESMQRFSNALLEHLQRHHVRVETIRPEPVFGKLVPGNRGLAKWIGYIDKFFVFPRALRRRLRGFGPGHVLHICDHSSAVYTRYARQRPHLVTVHDLLAIRSALGEIPENHTGVTGRVYQKMIRAGLGRAQRAACISRATREDLHRLTPLPQSQTILIHNSFNYPYAPMDRAAATGRIARKLGAPLRPFILHVGGNQWYKNRRGVVGIYSELIKLMPEAPQLMLVGKPLPPELRAQIQQPALAARVVTMHNADNEDLRALYCTAEALLFPSLMEGFGWPIIEAQACGCAVATTDAEPMIEAAGGAAALLQTTDWSAAARTLRDLLLEPPTARAARIQKGFQNTAHYSPDEMIASYIEQYRILTAAT